MNHFRLAVGLLAGLAVGAAAPAFAEEAHHHSHDEAPAKLELNAGKKWATDAPLRQAMQTMRTALAKNLHAIHRGSLAQADYAALGGRIETQVGAIVSQCKLGTRADAMLHVVIGELVAAADVMQGKTAGDAAGAAHRAAMALNDYGRHFNHPGWQALK